MPDGNDELDRLRALVRAGGALAPPEVQEIRPEIRSAGTWHLVDPGQNRPDAQTAVVTRGMDENYLLGMLLRQVTYYVPPDRVAAFQAWLFRTEPELRKLADALGVLYRGTYGVFGRAGTYTTLWGYRSFDAIQQFSNAVADPDDPLGARLREFQNFTDQSDPSRYQEQLCMPAASGRSLVPDPDGGGAVPPATAAGRGRAGGARSPGGALRGKPAGP